jgi:hypothetical protein
MRGVATSDCDQAGPSSHGAKRLRLLAFKSLAIGSKTLKRGMFIEPTVQTKWLSFLSQISAQGIFLHGTAGGDSIADLWLRVIRDLPSGGQTWTSVTSSKSISVAQRRLRCYSERPNPQGPTSQQVHETVTCHHCDMSPNTQRSINRDLQAQRV